MGSKKKNAAKNSSVHQTDKKSPSKQVEKTSNGIKQKRAGGGGGGGGGESKPRKISKGSSGTRWVAIFLLSGVVAAVAVFYASPEVRQAVNELITRYTAPDLLNPSDSRQTGDVKNSVNVGGDVGDGRSQNSQTDDKNRHSTQSGSSVQQHVQGAEDSAKAKDGAKGEPKVGKSVSEEQKNQQKASPRSEKENKQRRSTSDDKGKESTQESRKDSQKVRETKPETQKPLKKTEQAQPGKTEQVPAGKAERAPPEQVSPEKTDHHSKGETQKKEEKKKDRRRKEGVLEEDVPARGSSKMERQKEEEDVYSKADITNNADYRIREQLDEVDDRLDKNLLEESLALYERVLDNHPNSPRALYGRAMALDKLSEMRRSNEILEMSLQAFEKVLKVDHVPDQLFKIVGRRLAERQQFRGYGQKAAKTHELLTKKFPFDFKLLNELGVSYLMIGHNNDAKDVFKKVLKHNPRDGFALAHLGFVLKTSDKNPVEAVPYLERGLQSGAEGTLDGRFFYHLGDALQRLGNVEKAYKYYQEAASLGLFLSAHQRSLYNVDDLQSHPWWTPGETGHNAELQDLKKHWREIRDEAVKQMDAKSGLFMSEDENLREKGEWKQFTLFQQGRKNKKNCEKMPLTCSLVEKIPDASGCKRGQVKFSVMQPGVHVWPHCGPTNCRIRAHLGLIVPEGPLIRVVNETRKWKEGEFIIFDDSFEHEVWHEGSKERLVLIIDFWHPKLSEEQKWNLTPI